MHFLKLWIIGETRVPFVTLVQQSQSLISLHILILLLDTIYVYNKLLPRQLGKQKDKKESFIASSFNRMKVENSETPA